jgi:hypothetical protein
MDVWPHSFRTRFRAGREVYGHAVVMPCGRATPPALLRRDLDAAIRGPTLGC